MRNDSTLGTLITAFLLACVPIPVAASDDWPPITPEDLAFREVPGQPDEHAVILKREEDTDDTRPQTRYYYRIKILTAEGRKYADVEIPHWGGQVDEIRARTTRPDGGVVNFEGTVYDKALIKGRGLRISVKSFTLPEVQPGSIVEYRYRRKWPRSFAGTVWEVQDRLFTRRLRLSLKTSPESRLHWVIFNLPQQHEPKLLHGVYQMELENIPAFIEEDFMPPPAIVKPRIEFFYQSPFANWSFVSEYLSRAVDKFAGKPKKLEALAAEIAPRSEPAEQRLRKVYARAQQIRNLSFERSRSEKEAKLENLKENGTAEDVFKRGYGSGREINLLFLALARAAGFEAKEIFVTTRDSRLFNEHEISMSQLNAWLVEVQVGEKTYYLDPATRFCPFGLLSWEQTGVRGIRVTAGGSTFVQIPQPRSSDAVVERRGILDLDAEGALRGKLEVAFRGQEALHRRLNAREMDEAARLKAMESEVTGWFQAGTSVKLDRITGWDGSDEPLKVDITVAIPEFASTTGRRLLLPATLFRVRKDMLRHPTRVHPVYFPYPYQEVDSLQVRLPETLQIESLPPAQKGELVYANYQVSVRAEEPRSLTLERRLRLDGYFFKIDQYPSIRSFYEAVRKGDEQQLVLQIRR